MRPALDAWFEAWEWMQVEIEEIDEVGDRCSSRSTSAARGSGSGIEIEMTTFNVYTFQDGKVTRMQFFASREPALEAAGLDELQEERR